MGLDIYLYTKEQHEANQKHAVANEAFYGREDYDDLTEEQRTELSAAIPAYTRHVDVPSERYPEHLFNRRYLRSSYNGGGFNRSVPEMVGEDHGLYWIFEPMGREWDGDEGVLTAADIDPLRASKARALQVAEEIRTCDPLRTISEGLMVGSPDHMWHEPPTEEQVLAWYREEKKRNEGRDSMFGGESYSCAKGLVLGFTEGLEVLAVTVGRDVLGRPAAVLVYRLGKEAIDSYVQSAEITAEFCDEAVGLIERDGSCHISWSG